MAMSVVLVLKAGNPRLALLKRADNLRIIVKNPTGSDDELVLPWRPNDFKHLALLVAALVGKSVQCMDAILHHLFDLWYTFFRSSPTFFQEYAL
jgi:hypothetical protein